MNYYELFEKHRVIKTGHFRLTSGKHSTQYINKDAIYSIPVLFNKVVMRMQSKINPYVDTFDVVTGPVIAGAVLAAPISLLLYDKIFVYPEKVESEIVSGQTNMVFRRGYDKRIEGKRVWIIEDIITTGGSVVKTMAAVEKCGGEVTGISAIWNRGSWQPITPPRSRYIQFTSLTDEYVPSYWPEDCPDCKAGIPLQDPKKG